LVDGKPGFCASVFDYLKTYISQRSCENECCLVLDAMSIRQLNSWDHTLGKYVGHVDYGCLLENSDKLASEVLVFMAVGLTGR